MATTEDYEALKAGFRVLAEAARSAAFGASGFRNGPLVDVVNDIAPLLPADEAIITRAEQLI